MRCKLQWMKPGPCGIVAVLFLFSISTGCAAAAGSPGSLHDFTSDGCTLFPDGTLKNRTMWCDCCFRHDIAYWTGGTKEDRLHADEALRDCVLERTGDKELAELMFIGVWAGGHPAFPTWYRWAYGWKYGKGYAPLSDEEKEQVRIKLDDYRAKHPDGYCRPRKTEEQHR